MTTPKCPLCSNDVRAVYNQKEELWSAGCFDCGWRTALFSFTREDALQGAGEFISKFPRLMTASRGDKIRIYYNEHKPEIITATIDAIDIDEGWLIVSDSIGFPSIKITPADVACWDIEKVEEEGGLMKTCANCDMNEGDYFCYTYGIISDLANCCCDWTPQQEEEQEEDHEDS